MLICRARSASEGRVSGEQHSEPRWGASFSPWGIHGLRYFHQHGRRLIHVVTVRMGSAVENLSDAEVDSDAEADVEPQAGGSSANEVGEVADAPSTTLVEVIPGTAVVFGDVPQGFEIIDFGLIPSSDRARLSTALGSIGNAATIGGNLANAVSSAKGLYRVTDATRALLESGGKLASKDGAKLGAIFKNGDLVGQARFVPYTVTAAEAVAAFGPAVAMIALQMQLNEISGLVQTNIALTAQTLKTIRHLQWAELNGLAKSVDRAIDQANQIESVTRSLWESISGNQAALDKQLDLYKRSVNDHVQQLGLLTGNARREYLEANAEAVLFDANALLYSLKAQTGYQALRAARSRAEGADNQLEAQLVDVITRDARTEFDAGLAASSELVSSLARELRIIAELPGRATMPLTKKRRDAKASQLTCADLLAAIEPLANVLYPAAAELGDPELVCAPESFDLEPYLHILRWYLEDGEVLRGVAFPYQPGSHDLVGALPPVLGARVDATWAALAPGAWAAVVDKAASSTFVAVTDRRVITAAPRALLNRGVLGESFSVREIHFVRPPLKQHNSVRPTIDVITENQNLRWLFPSNADEGTIDKFAAILEESATSTGERRPAIEDGRRRPSEAEEIVPQPQAGGR